ncbi:MAG: hypothetical protein NVSMB52_11840 [Chloroflexota bacterium]
MRILVDRYWPRGVLRDDARVDDWLPEVAPSPALIAWFGHRTERWDGFRDRYWNELAGEKESLEKRESFAESGIVTLVYGARDREHNNARALADYLDKHLPPVVQRPTRRRPPPRIHVSGGSFQWALMIVGLFSPFIALIAVDWAVSNGLVGWELLGGAVALACLATAVRVFRLESLQKQLHGEPPREDREPLWSGVRSLGTWVIGPMVGLAVLSLSIIIVERVGAYLR